MRYMLMLIVFAGAITLANAQTTGSGNASGNATGNKKSQAAKQAATRKQRGTGQYHGNRDTTPGSPMGTGGAGGDMSGSRAASAIETDDQTSKADVKQDTGSAGGDTISKKPTIRRNKSVNRPTRRNL